jgi:predicted AAA+ superfamily ATPase
MEVQIEQVIREKIISSIEKQPPSHTRREVDLPPLKGKALAVIGMRRAGKTTFLQQCRAEKLLAGRSPQRQLYFNFEDERLIGMKASELHRIPEALFKLFPQPASVPKVADEPLTLYLDEIQVIPGWESFVRRLLDDGGYEVYISGSSAKLLSREIATSMRGRAWETSIYPFSFLEFLRHHELEKPEMKTLSSKQSGLMDYHYGRYLKIGGFPEAQFLEEAHRRQLLQGYVDVLLLRDVIERHEVRNPTALRWLLRRLLSSPAGLFSVTKFSTDLKSQGLSVSRESLYSFLAHLEDAFLLHTIPVATDSEKRRQVNPRKVYPADTSLIPVFDRSGKANTGHALESLVFTDLLRKQAEVAYVRNAEGTEVDFLARYPDHSEELIQVCATVDDAKTLAREVRALEHASSRYPRAKKLILTLESRLPFPSVPERIAIMPAWQWHLMDRSL